MQKLIMVLIRFNNNMSKNKLTKVQLVVSRTLESIFNCQEFKFFFSKKDVRMINVFFMKFKIILMKIRLTNIIKKYYLMLLLIILIN